MTAVRPAFAPREPGTGWRRSAIRWSAIDAQELIIKDPKNGAELLSQGLKKLGRDLPVEVLEIGINDFVYEHGLTPKKEQVFDAIFTALKARGKYRGDKPDFKQFMNDKYYQAALKIRK